MRRFILSFIVLFFVSLLPAAEKIEVFTLENREAASLVEVIANVVGPEGRVTADERTNSLIVAYPSEKDASLRQIIAKLDRAEVNVEIELVTYETNSQLFNRLGITGRTSLNQPEYTSILSLLTTSKDVELVQRQSVTTRNNTPARIFTGNSGNVVQHGDHIHAQPPTAQAIEVLPRQMRDGIIEVQLATVAPTSASPRSASQIHTTVAVADGGALILGGTRQESSTTRQDQVPVFPLGLEKSAEGKFERITFLHVSTTDPNSETTPQP